MKKNIRLQSFIKVIVVCLVMFGILLLTFNTFAKRNTNKIRLGFTNESLEALTILAQQKDFFSKQGLQIEIKSYDVGKAALEKGLIRREVDIAPAANTPIVISFLDNHPIQVLAVMGRSDDQLKVLAKKSSGILNPQDLKGKRILVQKGSAAHYFISQFLESNQIRQSDVSFVFEEDVKLFPEKISSNTVDALCIKEPILSKAAEKLKTDGIIFKTSKMSFKTFSYVVHTDFLKSNPETVKKVMTALYEAELFLKENPEESKQIVASYPGMDRVSVESQWDTQNIELILDDIYYSVSQEQSAWALSNNLSIGQNKSDIKNLIYSKTLRQVKPQGVYINF